MGRLDTCLKRVLTTEEKRVSNIMNHQYFVPVSDDIIYNHPEQIEGPLVPYIAGMECQKWLSIEINPDESMDASRLISRRNKSTPKLRLAYSAN